MTQQSMIFKDAAIVSIGGNNYRIKTADLNEKSAQA